MSPAAERGSLSLRVSVTDRCGLGCVYCTPERGVRSAPLDGYLSFDQIVSFVRLAASHYRVTQVRITGGEPLARPHLEVLIASLSALGIPDIALTTNGQALAQRAHLLRRAGLHRLNVSLDSLRPEVYAQITRGGDLRKTLDGLQAASEAGFSTVKLNMVVLRGINHEEVNELAEFGIQRGYQVRFLELMPIGLAAEAFARLFVSSEQTRELLRRRFTLQPEPFDVESTSRNYRIQDRAGREGWVGFISPSSEPFCSGCRRLRLTASGGLIGCLARPHALSIRPLLERQDAAGLLEAIEQALGMKRRDDEFVQPRPMIQIGG